MIDLPELPAHLLTWRIYAHSHCSTYKDAVGRLAHRLLMRPLLSTTSAFLITFSFATAYVGGLYLSKNARVSFASVQHNGDGKIPRQKLKDERWRDDPDVIRARIIVVTFATLACCLAVFAVLWMSTDLTVAFHFILFSKGSSDHS